ncbi:uncharacterized protein LY89DRAFT_477772 [Mollisia scopiformis]|uniref:Uncharacterized protein n=1 Tax=Mollisia scopiformis TaxID=149040 RepID=A0A194XG64_MOLSC|nr:uncharacterized protein LY89DRAFT_477772 [Mollisia scopiformis]KUJ19119.1 hypothetical protein LY89DRAFT_477772 [Mollisia scopiformis]
MKEFIAFATLCLLPNVLPRAKTARNFCWTSSQGQIDYYMKAHARRQLRHVSRRQFSTCRGHDIYSYTTEVEMSRERTPRSLDLTSVVLHIVRVYIWSYVSVSKWASRQLMLSGRSQVCQRGNPDILINAPSEKGRGRI